MKAVQAGSRIVIRAMAVIVFLAAQAAFTQTIDSIKGPLCVVYDTVSKKSFTLSPEHSTYSIVVTDGLAHVKIEQLYVNSFGRIKDIVYVFPMPNKGSVHAMSMLYKNELYQAKIMEKQEAQRKYDSVVNTGGTGALLLQERPNIFQQRLANIAYGDSASVTIGFSMPLKYDNGTYELAIPTMIGERYQSKGQDFVPSGPFWNPPENQDGQSLQINVLIQTGFEIINLESPTHPMVTDALPNLRQILEDRGVFEATSEISEPYGCGGILLAQSTYPNRDFVLRFSRKKANQDFSLASCFDRTRNEGYFAMNIFPDTSIFTGPRPNLDIVLMVDHSGSQSGWPLEAEKKVSAEILSRLLPTDKLTVLAFQSAVTWAFGSSAPREATAENIAVARSFINALSATGGTELLNAVQAALAVPQNSGYERYYIFLTDGFVTNETAIITAIKDHPSNPTVFTFGCGNSINRYLIDEAAATGNGGYGTVITELEARESVVPFVDAAWEKISTPQLKNVTVDFGTASGANNLLMPSGTNLFTGRPIEIYGTYTTGGQAAVTVKGLLAGKEVVIQKDVTFAANENMNFMVPKIWAREYIEYLSINEGTTQANKAAIIEVSSAFQVLSKYTAFLAISPRKSEGSTTAIREFPSINKEIQGAAPLNVIVSKGSLTITLPQPAVIEKLLIYDLKGRLIYTMPFNTSAVTQRIFWDGKAGMGSRLKPGTYVVCIKTKTGILKSPFMWK
jgi:Ca-activated chloride channel family protein